jgi:hypothetical protein
MKFKVGDLVKLSPWAKLYDEEGFSVEIPDHEILSKDSVPEQYCVVVTVFHELPKKYSHRILLNGKFFWAYAEDLSSL